MGLDPSTWDPVLVRQEMAKQNPDWSAERIQQVMTENKVGINYQPSSSTAYGGQTITSEQAAIKAGPGAYEAYKKAGTTSPDIIKPPTTPSEPTELFTVSKPSTRYVEPETIVIPKTEEQVVTTKQLTYTDFDGTKKTVDIPIDATEEEIQSILPTKIETASSVEGLIALNVDPVEAAKLYEDSFNKVKVAVASQYDSALADFANDNSQAMYNPVTGEIDTEANIIARQGYTSGWEVANASQASQYVAAKQEALATGNILGAVSKDEFVAAQLVGFTPQFNVEITPTDAEIVASTVTTPEQTGGTFFKDPITGKLYSPESVASVFGESEDQRGTATQLFALGGVNLLTGYAAKAQGMQIADNMRLKLLDTKLRQQFPGGKNKEVAIDAAIKAGAISKRDAEKLYSIGLSDYEAIKTPKVAEQEIPAYEHVEFSPRSKSIGERGEETPVIGTALKGVGSLFGTRAKDEDKLARQATEAYNKHVDEINAINSGDVTALLAAYDKKASDPGYQAAIVKLEEVQTTKESGSPAYYTPVDAEEFRQSFYSGQPTGLEEFYSGAKAAPLGGSLITVGEGVKTGDWGTFGTGMARVGTDVLAGYIGGSAIASGAMPRVASTRAGALTVGTSRMGKDLVLAPPRLIAMTVKQGPLKTIDYVGASAYAPYASKGLPGLYPNQGVTGTLYKAGETMLGNLEYGAVPRVATATGIKYSQGILSAKARPLAPKEYPDPGNYPYLQDYRVPAARGGYYTESGLFVSDTPIVPEIHGGAASVTQPGLYTIPASEPLSPPQSKGWWPGKYSGWAAEGEAPVGIYQQAQAPVAPASWTDELAGVFTKAPSIATVARTGFAGSILALGILPAAAMAPAIASTTEAPAVASAQAPSAFVSEYQPGAAQFTQAQKVDIARVSEATSPRLVSIGISSSPLEAPTISSTTELVPSAITSIQPVPVTASTEAPISPVQQLVEEESASIYQASETTPVEATIQTRIGEAEQTRIVSKPIETIKSKGPTTTVSSPVFLPPMLPLSFGSALGGGGSGGGRAALEPRKGSYWNLPSLTLSVRNPFTGIVKKKKLLAARRLKYGAKGALIRI